MKKFISAILALTLIVACGVTTLAETTDGPTNAIINVNDTTTAHSPVEVTTSKVVAQYLNIDKNFSTVMVCCPSYSDNIGSLTLTLYPWNGDYDSTINGMPIKKATFTDFNDNSWLSISAGDGNAFASGEYMWTLTNPVQKVGVWKSAFDNIDTDIEQTSYLGGTEMEGCLETRIEYAADGAKVIAGSSNNLNSNGIPKDSSNIVMYVDNNKAFVKSVEEALDVAPTVINGRTLVPARFVAEKLGAVVTWDEDAQAVIIETDNTLVSIVLGASEFRISGEAFPLDVPARIINGRTMVPLRVIANALGQQVNYFADGNKGLIVVGPQAESFKSATANAFIQLYK
ncbi:MAG: copper amine oxidase N-terminal domain-containing protein [Bacillota bacterium]|nr:copper amine oxidase N-terminal domain-containing protein [Bacillota bacterium]